MIEIIETVMVGDAERVTTLEWDPEFPHVVELHDARSDGIEFFYQIPRPLLIDATNLDPAKDHHVPGPDAIGLHVYPDGPDEFVFVRRPHLDDCSPIRIARKVVTEMVTESMRDVPLDRKAEMRAWRTDLGFAAAEWDYVDRTLTGPCSPDCPCGGRNTPRFF